MRLNSYLGYLATLTASTVLSCATSDLSDPFQSYVIAKDQPTRVTGEQAGPLTLPDVLQQIETHLSQPGTAKARVNESAAGSIDVLRVSPRLPNSENAFGFDPVFLLAFPVGAVIEALKWIVVEDSDSFWFTDRYFDAFFVSEHDREALGPDDEIEISAEYLGVDNFIEGRLRDSLGGDGGELSLQVTLAALDPTGNLLDQSLDLVKEEITKRRFALLLALEATTDGKQAVDDLRARLEEGRKSLDDGGDDSPRNRLTNRLNAESEKVKDRKSRREVIDHAIRESLDRSGRKDTHGAARIHLERVRSAIDSRDQSDLSGIEDFGDLVNAAVDSREEDTENLIELLAATGTIKSDEKGLYEEVKLIQGLAQADHFFSREFTGVRPKLISNGGTAAPLIPNADEQQRDAFFHRRENVVYRGKISELSKLGEACGFALSVLLLERDSDRIVEALSIVQKYAEERNLSVNAGGVPIEIGPLAEALGVIAQQIADDDVELKCIDLRLSTLVEGANSGPPVLKLKPGWVVVTRNTEGCEFGALAAIQIKRVQ